MAAITVAPENIGLSGTNTASAVPLIVGQATSQGQLLYQDQADGLWKLADADAEATCACTAMALTKATASGETVLAVYGPCSVYVGSVLTAGTDYYVHTTSGSFGVRSELSSGDFVRRIGIAKSSTVLYLEISGVTVGI